MDHFWIILGPFSTILLTVLSTLCQWSCGLVHHFLEAKLLEQVNLHFWIIYNTYSFGYQTGRRTGLVLWGKLSLSGKGLGQGFLNVAEMMVLVVFLDSIVF